MKQNTCIIKDGIIDADIDNLSIKITFEQLNLLNKLVYAAKTSNTGCVFTDEEGIIHNVNVEHLN